ncbi:MAG: 3-oxoacyl-ACP reductase FabG [Planctomycetes bacterium]|nr:3-oxoacyl-ACP reductase FabG [Planctomycetota bacterium]
MGKTVMVTGASRGLGRSIAYELADAGYDLWLTYQSSDAKALEVKEEVESKGVKCRLMKFDICDREKCASVISEALQDETPWGLVNNAGITDDGLFIRMKADQFDRVVDTGLKGLFNVTQPIVSAMLKKKQGRVINMSSVVGIMGNPGQFNYAAAKAGMIGATKSLAKEVARRNILVNCIAPGYIATEMTEGLNVEAIAKSIPLQRLGDPKNIADMVQFLLGKGGDYITGQVISINGGLC